MKAQRRQDLKTNDLAVYLQQLCEYLKENAIRVSVISVLLVLLVFTVVYRSYTTTQAREQGWLAYFDAEQVTQDPNDPDWAKKAVRRWEEIITAYDDPAIRSQATWTLGSFCLFQAIQSDEADAKAKLLDQAEEQFKIILSDFESNMTLQAAALNELAAIEQDRFLLDGDLSHKDNAKRYLERIRNDEMFLGSPFQTDVLARLNKFDDLWAPLVLVEPPPPPVVETKPASEAEAELKDETETELSQPSDE